MKVVAPVLALVVVVFSLPAQMLPQHSKHSTTRCRPGVYHFKGKVHRGQTFAHTFGGFLFTLVPIDYGWHIDVSHGQQHGLEGITGPLHFVPNPTDIEGWHFRNAANTGRNTGDVNAPDETRHFLFSPRSIRCEGAASFGKDGQGTLEITDMELDNLKPGEKANMQMMEFTVTLNVGRSACFPCPSEPSPPVSKHP